MLSIFKFTILLSLLVSCNVIETIGEGVSKVPDAFFDVPSGKDDHLFWAEGDYSNVEAINAEWSYPIDANFDVFVIKIFDATACSGNLVHTSNSHPSSEYTYSYAAGLDGYTYSYKLEFIDSITTDKEFTSCSEDVTVDWTAPSPAATLSWDPATATTDSIVSSVWVPSVSLDVASQSISYYTGTACDTLMVADIHITATATSNSFTFSSAGNYSFKVTTEDYAGNTTPSGCSSSLLVNI